MAASVVQPKNMEDIFKNIGGLGSFQVLILSLMLFMEIPTAFLAFSPIVIGITPEEWLCDNQTISKLEACSCQGHLSPIRPENSIVGEWKLICEYAWVADAILSLQLFATVFGNMVVSVLSDWYGRKYCYFVSSLLMILGTVITAVSNGPLMYAIARVICGISLSGFMTVSSVYMIEFMPSEYRMLTASTSLLGEGVMIMSLLAYYIRPWRTLLWITAAPHLLCFVILFAVPESPRWLLRNQQIAECHRVINKMAKMNGAPVVSLDTLEDIAAKERTAATNVASKTSTGGAESDTSLKRFSYFDFYRYKSLRKMTLILQVMWFSWGLVYFGITFNVKNLGMSLYLSLAFMGLADAVGYPMALLIPQRHGRLRLTIAFLGMSAIFFTALAVFRLFTDFDGYDLAVGSLMFLGKFSLSSARTPFRTLTGESYPTAVRTMGIGLIASLASIGAGFGPQLVYLASWWPSLPYLSFAGLSIISCCLSAALAETGGKAMLEEVQVNQKRASNPS